MLSIGSNLGDRLATSAGGRRRVRVRGSSPCRRCTRRRPGVRSPQADYLNAIAHRGRSRRPAAQDWLDARPRRRGRRRAHPRRALGAAHARRRRGHRRRRGQRRPGADPAAPARGRARVRPGAVGSRRIRRRRCAADRCAMLRRRPAAEEIAGRAVARRICELRDERAADAPHRRARPGDPARRDRARGLRPAARCPTARSRPWGTSCRFRWPCSRSPSSSPRDGCARPCGTIRWPRPMTAIAIARCVALGKASALVGAAVAGAAVALLARVLPEAGTVSAAAHDAGVGALLLGCRDPRGGGRPAARARRNRPESPPSDR